MMMKTAIEQQTGIDLNSFQESVLTLMNKLKTDKEQRRIYYYGLGYLFESNPSGNDISNARKWYGYAFQMGYYPAYYKLDSLYKYISKSKLGWLKENYEKDFYQVSVNVNERDETYNIYIMDFPPDPNQPIGHEMERLQDVYGVTIRTKTVEYFKQLYDLSVTRKVSFTDLCRYAIEEAGKKTHCQKETITFLTTTI